MVAKIFFEYFQDVKGKFFLLFLWMTNSTIEHDTTELLHDFTQNQLHILMISIFHTVKKYPKLVEIPYYRLGVLLKFWYFHNVLKTQNNLYQ